MLWENYAPVFDNSSKKIGVPAFETTNLKCRDPLARKPLVPVLLVPLKNCFYQYIHFYCFITLNLELCLPSVTCSKYMPGLRYCMSSV
jgi:hypothetical protein